MTNGCSHARNSQRLEEGLPVWYPVSVGQRADLSAIQVLRSRLPHMPAMSRRSLPSFCDSAVTTGGVVGDAPASFLGFSSSACQKLGCGLLSANQGPLFDRPTWAGEYQTKNGREFALRSWNK